MSTAPDGPSGANAPRGAEATFRPLVLDPPAVTLPKRLASVRGLHVVPQIRTLDPVVYFLMADRPPAAPGLADQSEVIYVGKTDDFLASWLRHRTKVRKGLWEPFQQVAYVVEHPRTVRDAEAGFIKWLLPRYCKQHKALTSPGVTERERAALERHGVRV